MIEVMYGFRLEVNMYIMILMMGCVDLLIKVLEPIVLASMEKPITTSDGPRLQITDAVLSEIVVSIPAGTFSMGCFSEGDDCLPDAQNMHKVKLTQPFALMKTEVTQALYESVMGENPSVFKGGNRPVEMVSWYETIQFANKLSEMEGTERCYEIDGEHVQWNGECKGWRLPTEAEWEYAARGGENYKYSGSDNAEEVAWYPGNTIPQTHNVGQLKANGFGLYDMSGNVGEWVWDRHGAYSKFSQTDPLGHPSGSKRVVRGGSCFNEIRDQRVSNRRDIDPKVHLSTVGFRLARTL